MGIAAPFGFASMARNDKGTGALCYPHVITAKTGMTDWERILTVALAG